MNLRMRATGIVGGIAVLLAAGCNRVQNMLAPAGDQASDIGRVWDLMLWVCVPVYALVLVALGIAVWRNHGAVAGDRALERGLLGWSITIAVLLTVLTATSFAVDRRLHARAEQPLQVRITAKRWWWQVEYRDPTHPSRIVTTANELHLPAGRTARIELQSSDVIHSLWIPVLAGKEDLIPGHDNVIDITPRVPGLYRGQCAEFCGLQHAHMALDVFVETPQAFAAWRARQLAPANAPRTPNAARGQLLFEQSACAMCHRVQGTLAGGVTGPDLTHFASRRTLAAGTLKLDRTTVAAWIIDPQRYKPGANMPKVPLDASQVDAISDYLMELQ
jgi:cytochrome c oxidase subunit II